MSNHYFRFKQFTIQQDKTAMKVCTDACLFGAWIASQWIKNKKEMPVQVMDIGTGTGLLSLMLVQKVNATVDAVEIDNAAAAQALDNFKESPWKEKISVIQADIKEYNAGKKYGLIISNPPFYENDLKSGNAAKDSAMHDSGLMLRELAIIASNNLHDEGYFAVLLPFHRMDYFLAEAAINKLVNISLLLVKPKPIHSFTRAMFLFQKAERETTSNVPLIEKLFIKDVHQNYSPAFISYLEDYYLSL